MIRIAYVLGSALSAVLCGRIALQYYQLESYQLDGYLRAMRRNGLRAFLPGVAVAVLGALTASLLTRILGDTDTAVLLGMLFLTLLAALAYFLQKKRPAKKPLVVTPRVKRLAAAFCLLSLGGAAALVYGARVLPLCYFLPAAAPLLLGLSALGALPFECLINHLYLRDAMRRLDGMPDLIKIGITGSYGKTSVKFMLETILSERYRVLVTPGSFNTSMGVTRIIRERLSPEHQVFVAEMGARHRGDIKLLCKLVRPKYGILTTVGPQHLETFKTQEAICREKFELARAIPPEGAMVFGADGGLNEALYAKATCPKHLAGLRAEGLGLRAEGLGLRAEDIEVGPFGSRFIMTDGQASIQCETKLLGALNIGNLLVACTLARVLGMDLETIARGARRVKPVEHRLQLLSGTGGVTVIDDAFNANPVGAKAALEALRAFPGRRIVVTPGFVELGAEEARYQRELGAQIAACADVAVLVGKRHVEPIAQGLREAGFPEGSLHTVASLSESAELFKTLLRPGDVVLYENDLPDNYQE